MAALDLRSGVDQVWADSFDSEMQEWEEQLQEMQQKIEELYKVVEARRSVSNSSPGSTHLNIALLPVGGVKVSDTPGPRVLHRPGDHPGNQSSAGSDHTGFPGSGTSVGGPHVTLEALERYLGPETGLTRNQHPPRGAPNTASKGHQSFHSHHDGAPERPVTHRIGCVSRGVSWREPVWCPAVDRKCPAVDRKCVSPSVLRKFDAMLQENEGKTLIEGGTVTALAPASKALKVGGPRGPRRMPAQHCAQEAELQPNTWVAERILGKGRVASDRRDTGSPVSTRAAFSRPARPANQRPPSRWAGHAPEGKMATPAGPRSRSLSPSCRSRQRQAPNLGSGAETVIM